MSSGSYKQQFFVLRKAPWWLGFWNGYEAVGGGKLENNKWHHVALVRRNLRIYIYLDGILERYYVRLITMKKMDFR